jgi:hypothetical protein
MALTDAKEGANAMVQESVYQRVVSSVTAKYRKLEAKSAGNLAYQSISFGALWLQLQ